MRFWRPGWIELALAACCTVLAGLFLRSAAVDPAAYHRFDQDLATLRGLDAVLTQDVLRARYSLLDHYDGLVGNLGELARLREGVREPPEFFDSESHQSYREVFDRYEASALAKATRAEEFKSANAALRNSFVYFPMAVTDLLGALRHEGAEPTLIEHVRELETSVLLFESTNRPADRERAERAIAQLAETKLQAGTEPLLDAVRIHGANILERQPILDDIVKAITDAPTASLADELHAEYRSASQTAQLASDRFRMLLYLFGAMAVAGMIYAFTALRDSKVRLEETNRELDGRVRKRTTDLIQALRRLEVHSQELEELNSELEKSRRHEVELRDRFLSHVSHELRTPLAALHQFLEVVRDGIAGPVAEEQHQYLSLALKNANQLEAMIADLMDLTRLKAGKLRIEVRPVEIAPLVEEVGLAFHGKAAQRSIDLTVHAEETVPVILADITRVRQVLNNLVENAVKFTPEGGEVEIRASTDDEEGFVRLSVRDTGRGIAPDHLERIFERLHQISDEDAHSRAGLGLGLSITWELVHRQGGRIWVESEQGIGSTFIVKLPTFSVARLVRPAAVQADRLRDHVGLLSVTVATGGAASGRPIEASTRRRLAERLRHIAYYPTDVLLPSTRDDVFFLVAPTDETGMRALGERVSTNLASEEDHQLEVVVESHVETLGHSEHLLSVDHGLEALAERLITRMAGAASACATSDSSSTTNPCLI